MIAGLLPAKQGSITLAGQALPAAVAQRTPDQLRRLQLVFQSADTALNPRRTVERILGRPLAFFHGARGSAQQARIDRLLDLVQLPRSVAHRPPGALSGGQKQRVSFARALAAEPDLMPCDVVTSALDTVVGAAILDLIEQLRRELALSTMCISHDLHTVRSVCDAVMVLYAGRRVESGSRQAIETAPWHPYSDLLIGAVPELRPGWLEERGTVHSPPGGGAAQPACAFQPRCPVRIDGTCEAKPPP